jgi:hypothetical protein
LIHLTKYVSAIIWETPNGKELGPRSSSLTDGCAGLKHDPERDQEGGWYMAA